LPIVLVLNLSLGLVLVLVIPVLNTSLEIFAETFLTSLELLT